MARADAPQRVDEIADGSLVHARHARQAVFPARDREHRRQRTEKRPCVTEEKLGVFNRESARRSPPIHTESRPGTSPPGSERAQRFEHVPRVVGVEQVAHACFPIGKRRKEQRAIGNAFGTGQPDGARMRLRSARASRWIHGSHDLRVP